MVWGFSKKDKEVKECTADKESLSATEIEALETFREKIKHLPTPREL